MSIAPRDPVGSPGARRPGIPVLLAWLLMAASAAPAGGADRVAVVIGNNGYAVDPLKNCIRDARAIGGALQALGFTVRELHDADRAAMAAGLAWLEGSVTGAELGLFYYSGHGVQVEGVNYLIPVDADPDFRTATALRLQTIDANQVSRTLHDSGCQTSVLILDACRNTPPSLVARVKGAASRGLAPMKAFPGSLIAFAADENQTASDNPGGANGLYTTALLRHIREPGRAGSPGGAGDFR